MNLTTIGRIIFALTIAFFGIAHLTNAQSMAQMIPSLSGMAVPVVYITGACLLAAAVSFILNRYSFYAGILLAVFLFLVILLIHLPGMSSPDAMMAQTSMSMMLKDAAIASAALVIAGIGTKK